MNNDSQNTEGKGLAQTTADNIRKIQMLKRVMPVIISALPAIGICLLIILAVILVFMPIIATYDFSGGIFNSSTSYNERPPMTMNLGGYELEDVKIFQDIVDQREKFKKLGSIKSDPSEELDLSLLISTIQGNIINNFNDDGDVYKLDDAINENIEEINNFNSIEDFNEFIDKYGTPKQDPGTKSEKYDNDTILENDQNKDYYNNLKDKAGNVYYIYPGSRELLGNMVYNDISYGTLEYDRWQCESLSGWCDNSKAIWSDWSILSKITSNNGESADCEGNSAICNIEAAISYAKGYNGNSNSWEYKNVKFDLEQLRNEVLGGSDSDDIEQAIIDLSGDSEAIIPNGGFVKGQSYVTVSVKKKVGYDLYEQYVENVFFKHLFLDCDNCAMKDEEDDIKVKQASVMYDNIYNMKELFDYFNDGEVVDTPNYGNGGGTFGSVKYLNGKYAELPNAFYNQLALPFVESKPVLTSCFGYYDAMPGTKYYCDKHSAVDIVGGVPNTTIAPPADGVVSSCSFDSWGPYLEITHTLKDENNNDVKVISYYRHWLDMNGKRSCETFYEGKPVKQGEAIALESGQGGTGFDYAQHLHFGIKNIDGTLYNVEKYLLNLGVATSVGNGTTNCDEVRRICGG